MKAPARKIETIPALRLADFAVCGVIVLLIGIVFGQTLSYDFVNYDDKTYIYGNSLVSSGLSLHGLLRAFVDTQTNNWHPLTLVSHMIDCQLYDLKPGGHHFTNVLLHTIAAVLLFLWLRNIAGKGQSGSDWSSAFVTALFAIHPLRVESVAWIAERKDVLSAVFFFLTLLAYLRYARAPTAGRYVSMSILFACGLMAKPMLVTTPAVLLLLDYWPLKRFGDQKTFWRLLVEKIPLFTLSAGPSIMALALQVQSPASIGQLPFLWRVENALVTYVTYILQMFWPANLAVFYPHPDDRLALWQVALAAAPLIVVSWVVFSLRRNRPYLLVGWLWYLCMLIPVIGIVQVGLQGHADRYTYLPHIGLYIGLIWFLSERVADWRFRPATLAAAAIIIIVGLAGASHVQASYWKDSELLWKQAIANTSDNHLAHAHLADLLLRQGRIQEAIVHCQEAIRIRPNDTDAQNNLGLAYLQQGNEAGAFVHFEQSLAANPNNLNARINLAWVLATSTDPGRRNGARALELVSGIARGPGRDNPIVQRTLAAAYAENGQFAEAIEIAEQARQAALAAGNAGLAA